MYRTSSLTPHTLQIKAGILLVFLLIFLSPPFYAQITVNLPNCVDCDPNIDALDCSTATFNHSEFVVGELFQASMLLPYTGGNGQPVGNLSINSTGVTGLTADLFAMNLQSGAGNLIFYIYGNPSGEGTASFEVSFAGLTCSVDLALTETPSGANIASNSNGSCRLTSAKQIYGSMNNLFFLDKDGYIWVEGLGGLGGSKLLPFNDHSVRSQSRARNFAMPTRLKHPYYGTPQEVVFEKILTANTETNENYIVAKAADGKVWGWSQYHLGTSDTADGNILCKNCSGAAESERDFEISLAIYTQGWGRMVTPDGDDLIDFAIITGTGQTGIALDTNGKLWATSSQLTSPTSGEHTNYAGLGVPYSRTETEPSYKPITIPDDDPIVKIESFRTYNSGTRGLIALGASGKVYGWGNSNTLGYSNVPTELPLPNAGVTVVDIERHYSGVWLEGSDEKLYFVGNGNHRQFNVAGNASFTGIPKEVQGWTDLGVGLDYIISGGGNNSIGWAFMGTDGKMYISTAHPANDPAGPYGYGTNFDLIPYDDLSPNANLDYSSGMVGFAFAAGHYDGHFLLTNDALVTSQNGRSNELHHGLIGTLFPNVEFIQFCYGHTEPNLDYEVTGEYQYRIKSETISVPPNSTGND